MSDSTLIVQYCSVCKAEYEMSVIPTAYGDEDGVVWLQCPNCKGFLPKISNSQDFQKTETPADTVVEEKPENADTPAAGEEVAEASPEAGNDDDRMIGAPSPLADIDLAEAVPYRPWKTYEKGDVIHHLAWDDYGLVLEKEVLPGSRKVLKVHFTESGIVRLIEDDGDRP
jgi:hypothetical protein